MPQRIKDVNEDWISIPPFFHILKNLHDTGSQIFFVTNVTIIGSG
jgi:hypothetical protein